MTDTLALMPGTLIDDHYIVGALLNAGGFGSVYRGIDTSEGNRPCAIKETYDVSPSARRQALTEAAILFTINSPHLPQVYDAFEEQGRFYLVMELIEGQNLLELSNIRGRPFSEQEVLRWLVPVMHVLQELHSRNPAVIHRDIKPGNIILTPDERAVLVDFGLTRLYDPSSNSQTLVRAVSEGFSSLEQYIGKTTPQSDIYSMAATMYFLLTRACSMRRFRRIPKRSCSKRWRSMPSVVLPAWMSLPARCNIRSRPIARPHLLLTWYRPQGHRRNELSCQRRHHRSFPRRPHPHRIAYRCSPGLRARRVPFSRVPCLEGPCIRRWDVVSLPTHHRIPCCRRAATPRPNRQRLARKTTRPCRALTIKGACGGCYREF